MNCPPINIAKLALLSATFIFLMSGICLVLLGCVLANDTPRILLSRLAIEPGHIPQPLLYYVAIGFISVGMVVLAVGVLGCWAGWVPDSGCLLATYMFLLVVLLLTETSFGVVSSLCPQMLGINLDRDDMVGTLMNNYGVPGRDQYTAAVDLAQTLFECCGMQSGSDYDGSKWWRRERDNEHELRVPRSCCLLNNTEDETAFLDPKPLNDTLCQAKNNARYQYGRHVKGCIDKLAAWFQEHVNIFLIVGSALVIVQLSTLMCAILVCVKRGKTSPPSSYDPPLQPPPQRSSVAVATISRRSKHSEELVSRSDEKGLSFYGGNLELTQDNGFPLEQLGHARPPKQLNIIRNDELYAVKRNQSPVSVPLVLRNDHFQNQREKPSRNNTMQKRRQPRSHDEGPGPVYYSHGHSNYTHDLPRSDYFRKNEELFTASYNRYDDGQGT